MILIVFLWVHSDLGAQDRPQFVWRGQVDGTVILHLTGKALVVQVQDGAPVEREKFHFSEALSDTQQNIRVEVLEGRGAVRVIDQPNLENHYTASVAIEDRQPGSSFYSIALYWDTSINAFEGGDANAGRVSWTGRVDEQAVISCRKRSCVSSAERGAPVADEHFKFSRPLPEKDVDVRLQDPQGRGDIRLIEQPRQSNNYTARVSIGDPLAGSGQYSFTLLWNRVGSKDTAPIPEPTGRGMLWSGTVHGRVQVTVQGGATFSATLDGAPVMRERAQMFRQIPTRANLSPTIQKLRGRGEVSIVESPSEKNNYRLVFEIDDPLPGADDYEIEVDW
jgi:hypothetical protein